MAKFVIRIPEAPVSSAASVRRTPLYISPSTQSIAIAVDGGPQTIANLTPTSPGCTSATQTTPLTCTVSAPAFVGSDTFSLSLYAKTNAVGNVLSTASVAATIVKGQTNIVPVIMQGVIASVALALTNPNPPEGTAATIGLTVNANDAAGNIIIGPGGYQNGPITIADSDATYTSLTSPSVTDPTVSVSVQYDGGALTTATFSASTPNGAIVTNGSENAMLTPAYEPLAAPSSLAFTGTGDAYDQNVAVSEENYSGTFTAASFSLSGGIAPDVKTTDYRSFTVTPEAPCSCAITFTDSGGNSIQIPVTVGTTTITIQSKVRNGR